jgi:hypothetical protein
MRNRKPSPAMAVALMALFISLGGTSIAAVNYAANAGKVDGKDGVAATTARSKAAGDLVATNKSGPDKGKIPVKFLADVPVTQTFGQPFAVTDNAVGAPATLGTFEGIGNLTATCADQAAATGNEDPTTTLSFNSAIAVNTSKRTGAGNGTIVSQAAGTAQTLAIGGSSTFEYQIQAPTGTNLLIQGVVRQDGRGTPNATCLVYGTVLRLTV